MSPFYAVLNQFNPVHNFTPYFFKINFNIILQFPLGLTKWSLYSGFRTEILIPFINSPMRIVRSVALVVVEYTTLRNI
jgi:hypothetical protein